MLRLPLNTFPNLKTRFQTQPGLKSKSSKRSSTKPRVLLAENKVAHAWCQCGQTTALNGKPPLEHPGPRSSGRLLPSSLSVISRQSFWKGTTRWACNTHLKSARRLARLPSTPKSLRDVKMLTPSLLKRSFRGKKKSRLFKFSAIPVICSICSCIMMFVSEVTFQSNEASVTMCERCDKLSLI